MNLRKNSGDFLIIGLVLDYFRRCLLIAVLFRVGWWWYMFICVTRTDIFLLIIHIIYFLRFGERSHCLATGFFPALALPVVMGH